MSNSGAIITELEMRIISSNNEAETITENEKILREEVGKFFQEIRQKFADISWIEKEKVKIRKAILFEANQRFIEHPYDLRGLRHARYFQDCLYGYLDRIEKPRSEQCWHHKISLLFFCLKLKDIGRKYSPTKRSVSYARAGLLILTLTILVAAYDYFTDFVVLEVFWNIGKMSPELQDAVDDFSKLIFLIFQGPAVFLSMIFFFSLFFVLCQIPSIWYQYQVTLEFFLNTSNNLPFQ